MPSSAFSLIITPMLLALGPAPESNLTAAAQSAHLPLTHCPSVEAALITISAKPITLIFADHTLLPTLLPALKENRHSIPVIAIGPAQPATGAKAIRLGAIEYLTIPLEPALLAALISKAAATSATEGAPIAADPATIKMLEQAKQFATSDATILVRGESGTGKEVFARTIHQHSNRKSGPFIAVNCAAIPENLLESELFGHEKGAFSGAVAKRLGKFQQADGGTLLLDEISEMDLGLQAKLLRAIQERVVDPIGADKPVSVNIRLIATTNRQLEAYVQEGKFREDLYFRLNVVALELYPLRSRTGDILPLANHFAARYAQQLGFATPTISKEAQQKLLTCYWKGNVRELENTMHRAVLMAGKNPTAITPDHIVLSPMSMQHMTPGANNENARASIASPQTTHAAANVAAAYGGGNTPAFIPKRLADAERDILVQTLGFTQGNREIAADILGISVTILREKLAALGLA